jgi:WD40 repeat protein
MTMEEPGGKLQVQNCGGRDLTSNPLLMSADGKLVFTSGDKKVTVFNTETGQPVRELNTGTVVSLALNKDNPSQLVVARPHDLVTWDHDLAKVVSTETYFHRDFNKTVLEALIPSNYLEAKEIYAVVLDRHQHKLIRVDLACHSAKEIFQNVSPGSMHLGDSDNCVAIISDKDAHKNTAMRCYDRKLSTVQYMYVDYNRPLTIVRCHPTQKIIACGDASGRILIVHATGSKEVLKALPKGILHWHHCAILSLAWSIEGSHLYSGGNERVLCKWFPANNTKPSFLPRVGSEIIGLEVSGSGVAMQLANNSVKILYSPPAM